MDTKQLTGIPETMLTTLWAKATETKRPDALLRDIYATEIIKHVDYDFSKFKKGKFSQAGVCVRAKLIDDEVITFLKEYPDGVVIQLGAGLDARYQLSTLCSLVRSRFRKSYRYTASFYT